MKVAQRALVASFLTAFIAAVAGPTMAGGSLVDIEPRSWARQGAEIRLNGAFCNGSQAPVSAGPWFAYLDAPASRPVLMGRVHISPNSGNYCEWRLTATLRVPAVAPGVYWVQVCDRGCTQGVGDLMGAGNFTVVSGESPPEQAVHLQEQRARIQESIRATNRLEQLVAELDDSLTQAEERTAQLGSQVDRLSAELAAERAKPTAWFGGFVAIGVAVAALMLVLWRRRRLRVRVPDTPAELVEHAHAEH